MREKERFSCQIQCYTLSTHSQLKYNCKNWIKFVLFSLLLSACIYFHVYYLVVSFFSLSTMSRSLFSFEPRELLRVIFDLIITYLTNILFFISSTLLLNVHYSWCLSLALGVCVYAVQAHLQPMPIWSGFVSFLFRLAYAHFIRFLFTFKCCHIFRFSESGCYYYIIFQEIILRRLSLPNLFLFGFLLFPNATFFLIDLTVWLNQNRRNVKKIRA